MAAKRGEQPSLLVVGEACLASELLEEVVVAAC